jgi:hypothetical protein
MNDPSVEVPTEDFFRGFMNEYTEAWNREDLEASLDSYHTPRFLYADGTLNVFLDDQSLRKATVDWIEVNRKEGPASWEILSFSATTLGKNSALVTTRWVFRRPDGSRVWDFVDSHQLCRFDGRWKILARTLHD